MHQSMPRLRGVPFVLGLLLMLSLTAPFVNGNPNTDPWPSAPVSLCDASERLAFNGTKANQSVQWQVDLGPRLPGSNASAEFRHHLTTTLNNEGWAVTQTVHHRHGMNLTNLEARWSGSDPDAGQVVLSAHYDSRNIADHDENETNQSLPVPGANDGASGVAVLIELANHIPGMNLPYDVVLFWNDAEDQNDNYTVGAEAWAENLTQEEINATHAFVLLDMVGDADLQLQNINPGNDTLKERIVVLGTALGLVADQTDCHGNSGRDIIQYDVEIGVIDDHIHAHNLNIPSIDIMDPVYGEPKFRTFGSYWHTMEDTPDKVSAESLMHVGRLVELGLRTDAFVNVSPVSEEETNVSTTSEATTDDGHRTLQTVLAMAVLGVIGGLLAFADRKVGS